MALITTRLLIILRKYEHGERWQLSSIYAGKKNKTSRILDRQRRCALILEELGCLKRLRSLSSALGHKQYTHKITPKGLAILDKSTLLNKAQVRVTR